MNNGTDYKNKMISGFDPEGGSPELGRYDSKSYMSGGTIVHIDGGTMILRPEAFTTSITYVTAGDQRESDIWLSNRDSKQLKSMDKSFAGIRTNLGLAIVHELVHGTESNIVKQYELHEIDPKYENTPYLDRNHERQAFQQSQLFYRRYGDVMNEALKSGGF